MPEDEISSNEISPENPSHIFTHLKQSLPPLFSRKRASEALGGSLSPRTLANLDCANSGPPRIKIGRKVVYEREEFIRWLEERKSKT